MKENKRGILKTDFTKKEKERIEELRVKYLELDDHIKSMQIKIKLMKDQQDKVFAEYFGITHPEHKEAFDKRLLPYGW